MSLDDFISKKLGGEKAKISVPRSNTLPDDSVLRIIEKVKTELKFNDNDEAQAALAVLFQQGGTARSCDGNMTVKIFDRQVKLATIRKIIRDEGHNRGERKLARSIATDIHKICLALEIVGNLYQKVQRKDPSRSYTLAQQVWLSDFQSMNTDCPADLRTLLVESFQKEPNKPSKGRRSGK